MAVGVSCQTLIELCPSTSITTRIGTPCASINDAAECRRSWKLKSGRSAMPSSALNLRKRFRGSSGVPTPDVKTRPLSCPREPAARRS